MPRKKKVEEPEKIKEKIIEKIEKPVSYGSGWTGINNRLQAEGRSEK